MPEDNPRLKLLEEKLFGGDPYIWDGKKGLLGEFLVQINATALRTGAVESFVRSLQQIKVKNDLGDDIDFVEMVKQMYENTKRKATNPMWKVVGQATLYVSAAVSVIYVVLKLAGVGI